MKNLYPKKLIEINLFHHIPLKYFLLSLLFFSSLLGYAQGTSCSNASTITIDGNCVNNTTISDGTQHAPLYSTCAPSLGGTFRREGWYTFTVTNGPQEIKITALSTNRNLALQLIQRGTNTNCTAANNLTTIACADEDTNDDSAQIETITTTLNNGVYYIKVLNIRNSGNNTNAQQNMILSRLCVRTNTTSCATAQSLTIDGACATNQAITDVFESGPAYTCSNTFQRERWYSFTVTGGPKTISIEGTASNENLALQLYSGNCATSLTSLACKNDNNSNGAQTEIINTLLNDGTYFIKVLNVGNDNDMTLTNLCIKTDLSNCSNATQLVVDGPCLSGQTVTDPVASQPAICSGTFLRERWYYFEVTNGPQNISITATANRNVVLQLIDGTCGSNLTTLACQNGTTTDGNQTETLTQVLNNGIYYLKAINVGSNTNMTISNLCISTDPVTCATSIPMNIGDCRTGDVLTDNIPFAPSGNCGYTFYREGWYTFEVTGSTQSIGIIASTTNRNVALEIYQGDCNNTLTQVGCVNNTNNNNTQTEIFMQTLPVGTYYIRVLNIGTNADLIIDSLCIVNDSSNCNNAAPVAINGSCTTNQTIGDIFQSGPNYNCSGTFRSEGWYSINITNAPQDISIIANSADGNLALQVINGNCSGVLTQIACVNGTTTNNSSQTETLSFQATSNGIYYIKVLNLSTAVINMTLNSLCVVSLNDNCNTAIPLAVSPTVECITSENGSTQYASNSGIATTGCGGNADDDVWYSFVATNARHIVTATPGTISNIVVQIFRGNCGNLTRIGCADNNTNSTEAVVLSGLTIGDTYFVRVYSYANTNNSKGTFSICVTTNITCFPGNGTGTTTLSCPVITAGGLGLNGAPPIQVDCDETTTCRTLEAIYTPIQQTTSYTVERIAFNPPYQFNCLANPISVNVDDVWSQPITLPFNFCFYGNNYNRCIVGSNGVISFDLVNNTPGGHNEWSFNNNLPSANLFLNSIFGVYHDIDPSKGGNVGWELITLSSGCRALVASWYDIPMYNQFGYNCGNLKYTGMIVLYENTNIIEVYIKNKSACNWNNGNAVVGIQNATGTIATVAPGRNSLSTDWSVTDEAWRFVPAGGNSNTIITWYQGNTTTGTVIGNTATIEVCPTATTTYTAKVEYELCNGRIYTETRNTTVSVIQGKVWNGNISNNWNVSTNWTPVGVPTIDNCVIIPVTSRNPIISTSGAAQAYAKNVSIQNGASLQVRPNYSLTVLNEVSIAPSGSFILDNSANLVQINDNAVNSGSIAMTRSTTLKKYDYAYWSSPVLGFPASSISPTTAAGFIYKWNPTINNTNGGQGNWIGGNETMQRGLGYIVRAPNTFSTTGSPFSTTFTGEPFNGVIQPPIARGTITGNAPGTNGVIITNYDDNLNLVGNPYPSAISAAAFLTLNPNILGNVKLWTHGTSPAAINGNPFYGDFVYNYSVNDYVTYNGIGSNPPGFNGYIGAGQSFFVTMVDGAASTQNITFNNSLRHNGNIAYNNSQFYRIAQRDINTDAFGDLEKHRIWLSLANADHLATTTLIGYSEGATEGFDRVYDAPTVVSNSFMFYSLLDNHYLTIQGRSIPFNEMDRVPLGFVTESTGIYSVAIREIDGLFEHQNIYIEDTYTNTIHNLKTTPYQFTSQKGKYDNRFYLRYVNETLGIDQPKENKTLAFINEAILHIQANSGIKSVTVYDVAGKLVKELKNSSLSPTLTSNFSYAQGVYLAMIALENNEVIAIKLINQ